MKENADLIQALNEIKTVPDRDPAVVRENRAAFLREAAELAEQPVSNSVFTRLMNSFRLRQPQRRLSTLTIGILLGVMMLTFSSGVVTARRATPNQLLYPVKLWLEESRLTLTRDQHEQNDLRLEYAEERLHEIEGFAGQDLSATLLDFDEHFRALSEADDLDDVQEERFEKLMEQYELIHQEDEDESEDESEDAEKPENQPNRDENTASDENESSPDTENTEEETEDAANETENAPVETETPGNGSDNDSDDGSDDDKSPEETPDPDETPEEKETSEPDPTPESGERSGESEND